MSDKYVENVGNSFPLKTVWQRNWRRRAEDEECAHLQKTWIKGVIQHHNEKQ